MKKALIFWPYNAFPLSTGTHQVMLADLKCIQLLGYKVSVYSNDSFQHGNIEGLERMGVKVYQYRPSVIDNLFELRQKRTRPNSWDYKNSPWFLEEFKRVFDHLSPDLIIINYPWWGKLTIGEEFATVIRIMRCIDLLKTNERMIKAVEPHLFYPANPYLTNPLILQENFFSQKLAEETEDDSEEFQIYKRYDGIATVSNIDAQAIMSLTSVTSACHVPPAFATKELNNTYNEAPLLVISDYVLNTQAYLYFAARVLPLVLNRLPHFKLLIIGSGCKKIMRVRGVELIGFVPDLSALYSVSNFSICPVLGGTGIQIKILESMAHGVPVIALRNVARSSPIRHGVNGLIAEDAREFAEYTIQLSCDRNLCRKLGDAARETIGEQFSPEIQLTKWEDMVEVAGANQRKMSKSTSSPSFGLKYNI